MTIKIPLFISKELGVKIARSLPTLSEWIKDRAIKTDKLLKDLNSDIDAGEYIITSMFNSFLWAVMFAVLIALVSYVVGGGIENVFLPTIGSFIIVFVMFSLIFYVYPEILIRKEAEEIDALLVYALNDMIMNVTAGTSLMSAMRKVAHGNYGKVSEQFREVVEHVVGGESEERALMIVAKKTKSEFMRRVLWQLATVLRTGASLENSLRNIMKSLRRFQNNRITKYSQNLNFYILLYLMLAVVLPSLTILLVATVSVFLSHGGVINIGKVALGIEQVLTLAILVYIVIQVAVVEYIKAKRPLMM